MKSLSGWFILDNGLTDDGLDGSGDLNDGGLTGGDLIDGRVGGLVGKELIDSDIECRSLNVGKSSDDDLCSRHLYACA